MDDILGKVLCVIEDKPVRVGDCLFEGGEMYRVTHTSMSLAGNLGLSGKHVNGYNRFKELKHWSWLCQVDYRFTV